MATDQPKDEDLYDDCDESIQKFFEPKQLEPEGVVKYYKAFNSDKELNQTAVELKSTLKDATEFKAFCEKSVVSAVLKTIEGVVEGRIKWSAGN